jgi:hypothetical protein
MKIILLSAKAQNGKDSTANILKKYFGIAGKKSIILHYGDYLKFLCSKYFDWNGEKDEQGRTVLQKFGTEKVRNTVPDFWVRNVAQFIDVFQNDYDYFIIADCRFLNEVEYMKKSFPCCVTTIRIERLNFDNGLTEEQKNHPSETALDDFVFDYVIESESGLDKLEVEVNKIIDKL